MKYRIWFLVLLMALPMVAAGKTFDAGEYRTTVNLNIRSFPGVGNNRIGHFLQNDQVVVVRSIGNWCNVKYRKYLRAFVYCPYLEKLQAAVSQPNPVVNENVNIPAAPKGNGSSVETLMKDVSTWLNTGSLGVNYINDSYWISKKKALAWKNDAMLGNFNFEFSADGQPSCKFTFVSPANLDSTYITDCIDENTQEVNGFESRIKTTLLGFSDPEVVLKDFVSSILGDQTFLAQSKEAFGVNAQISYYFQLSMNAQEQLMWEAVFTDSVSGKTLSIQKPAMKA